MTKKNVWAVLAVCAVTLASCASVEHYKAIDSSFSMGDYPQALRLVEAEKGKGYRDKDAVLYNLDAGLLAHYARDYELSSRHLGDAEKGIEAAFTKSVSQGAASYLVNDMTIEYAGEDYEDLYLNVFNSLNYYHKGSLDGALVEVRRIDNKLKYLTSKYGKEISNAQKAALEKNEDVPYDASAYSTKFSNSALARYLGMLFYRADGLVDDARIDRDQVKLAFASQKGVYPFPVPKSLDDELSIPRGKARINVIGFCGQGPVKKEEVTRIPLGGMNWIKLSLPVMTSRPSAVSRISVSVDGGDTFDLELLEDLGAVAAETFKAKAGLIYFKTVIRSIAKTATSAALEDQADKGGEGALFLSLLSLGTQIYAEASEQADLRLGRFFPGKAYVGGITVAPGVYSYTVQYFNASGQLIDSARFEGVDVRPGRLNLSEAICVK